MRTVRIGNCSGFYGDRLSAMREMLEGGPLDYLTGDYLAELTMLILGRDRQKNSDAGYARTFLRQLTDCLDLIRSGTVRIVGNAGGLNPSALAAAIRSLDPQLKVAHVEGDDLLRTGRWPRALTANAYLGAFGIAKALQAGADIVVTGRVTDASLTLGPVLAEFGWTHDDLDKLAAGIVAGHVLECGAQATGGNFSGFTTIDTTRPLGFPIAEIGDDGTVVITKHPNTGGAVTVDTVTAQLVYEIGAPHYLNPDVTARLDTVRLIQEGEDKIKLSGVRGTAPPPTTKIGINRLGGHRNTVTFVLTGLDIEQKAAWARRQLESTLHRRPAEITWELVRTDRPDPATQSEASALLRCHVKDPDARVVGRAFSNAAVELALASYPGFHVTAPPSDGSPFGVFEAAHLPQSQVPHIAVLPDGTRVAIAPPPDTPEASLPPSFPAGGQGCPGGAEGPPAVGRDTTVAPLGRLVYARSGDKGGTANIGVWIPAGHPRRPAAYDWLAGWLDADRVRELLPETATLPVTVHALPNLAALNIVVDGLLGAGVAASTRSDPQAKAAGEWLRARNAEIPTELL
ncbi:acyclic terpene utilization AtuA family protein [Actinoplanes siamensis]|uniref:Exopolyphosphatase n=1 Tax=Actinoplanes siamensis TaxID=1223317 RepID=A0A919N6E9_9ACTN|nr:acyclic terpene utilization AtuA family protein [Actinoplanes siamensis]GIF05207.1 exopolyphosphatase [Actinoplanes siamensis]